MTARASHPRTRVTPLIGVACVALAVGLVAQSLPPTSSSGPVRPGSTTNWAAWVEPDFPFFSSVIDAGKAGPGFPSRNLTPRGLVLNLGGGYWAGFDVDLLRVAAIWEGNSVRPRALAPGSYHEPDRKTPGGQSPAPEPDGRVLAATGIYPGWQSGDRPSLDDPREPAPSPEEVGRGPLPEQMGRFKAVRLVRNGVELEYTVGGAPVREWMTVVENKDALSVVRDFEVGPATEPLWLILGSIAPGGNVGIGCASGPVPSLEVIGGVAPASVFAMRLPPRSETTRFCAQFVDRSAAPVPITRSIPKDLRAPRWPQEITTTVKPSTGRDPYVVDDIALPLDESLAAECAPRRHSVPEGWNGRAGHARRRRVAWPWFPRRRGANPLETLRVRPARAAHCGDPRRAGLRLRSQRHLAPARHEWRRGGRRPRALLERVRADRRHARVPVDRAPRSGR